MQITVTQKEFRKTLRKQIQISTLRSLIDVPAPPSPLPRLLIFRMFSTRDILIPHPSFIKYRKMFQPGHL